MIVSFADTCGVLLPTGPCGVESEQYRSFPTCRECGERVCPEHVAPGTLKEREYDRQADGDSGPVAEMSESVVCTVCQGEEK